MRNTREGVSAWVATRRLAISDCEVGGFLVLIARDDDDDEGEMES